jgi:outer membrane protein insertion porin family
MNKKLLAGLVSRCWRAPHWPSIPSRSRIFGSRASSAPRPAPCFLPAGEGGRHHDRREGGRGDQGLFATGFFKDVRLEIDGQVLVVVLEERPAIASLEFTGTQGLQARRPEEGPARCRPRRVAHFRPRHGRARGAGIEAPVPCAGHYAVQVTTTITPLERNRVGINFAVVEGEIAKIKQINIVGASAFKESDLLDLMALRTPNWLTWYTKNDQYSKQKLSGDLETCAPTISIVAISNSMSSRPRFRFRRTSRTSTSPSTSPRARSTPSPRSSWPASCCCRKTN